MKPMKAEWDAVRAAPSLESAAVPTVKQWMESTVGLGDKAALFIEMSGLQDGQKYLDGVKNIEGAEFQELLEDVEEFEEAVDDMVGDDDGDELTDDEAAKLKGALRALRSAGDETPAPDPHSRGPPNEPELGPESSHMVAQPELGRVEPWHSLCSMLGIPSQKAAVGGDESPHARVKQLQAELAAKVRWMSCVGWCVLADGLTHGNIVRWGVGCHASGNQRQASGEGRHTSGKGTLFESGLEYRHHVTTALPHLMYPQNARQDHEI
eukprot:COSAG01_NODE_15392_length_1343_cov_2.678457_1_plen_265_part_10